jgi:hypothetical protein
MQVEDEVVSLVAEREEDPDAKLDRSLQDCRLRDRAFLIRCEHTPTLARASDELLSKQTPLV